MCLCEEACAIPWGSRGIEKWSSIWGCCRFLLGIEPCGLQLYTSGSTGKPKGVEHTQAGYMVGAYATFKYAFDYHEGDVYWCTADCGWITGHSYVTYGESPVFMHVFTPPPAQHTHIPLCVCTCICPLSPLAHGKYTHMQTCTIDSDCIR